MFIEYSHPAHTPPSAIQSCIRYPRGSETNNVIMILIDDKKKSSRGSLSIMQTSLLTLEIELITLWFIAARVTCTTMCDVIT